MAKRDALLAELEALERELAGRKAELQVVISEINSGRSRLAAMKKEAADFANG